MATITEQLAEFRIAHIKAIYNGQPENVTNAAIKTIENKSFDSISEFEDWAKEAFQSDKTREATSGELDELFSLMGLGKSEGIGSDEKNIDEIMTHFKF